MTSIKNKYYALATIPIQTKCYVLAICIVDFLLYENFNDIKTLILIFNIASLCKLSRGYFMSNCPKSLILSLFKRGIINEEIFNNLSYTCYNHLIRHNIYRKKKIIPKSRLIKNNDEISETPKQKTKESETIIVSEYTDYEYLIILMSAFAVKNNIPKMLLIRDYLNIEGVADKTLSFEYYFNSFNISRIQENGKNRIFSLGKTFENNTINNSYLTIFKVEYCLLNNKRIYFTPEYFFDSRLCCDAVRNKNIKMLKYYYSFIPKLIERKNITKNMADQMKNAVLLSITKTAISDINVAKEIFEIVCENNGLFEYEHCFDVDIYRSTSDKNVDTISGEVHIELLFRMARLHQIFKKNFYYFYTNMPSLEILQFYIGQKTGVTCNLEKYHDLKKYHNNILNNPKSQDIDVFIAYEDSIGYRNSILKCECITFEQYTEVFEIYTLHPKKLLLEYLEHYRSHFELHQIVNLFFNTNGYVIGTVNKLCRKVISLQDRKQISLSILKNKCLQLENYFSPKHEIVTGNKCFYCSLPKGERKKINRIIENLDFKETSLLLKARKFIKEHIIIELTIDNEIGNNNTAIDSLKLRNRKLWFKQY